ncbi:MAG: hypothetical protein RR487_13145 [Acinetobacter sp.]
MKFIIVVFVFTLIIWVYGDFSHKKRLNSAVNSTNKIKDCGYFLGIESTKARFPQEYFVIQNTKNEKDTFNLDPKFDVHLNIKQSKEIKQGSKVCYEYTYVNTYMDAIKILTSIEKVNTFPII